ncbi:hypothetical protein Cdeb_01484 [Caldibacillus debilis GB1]|jgi:hypothetical protein|uniref:Uncharacterized protein n=1 Tax=Caldibacillus debilis GB1 TaxID=1339248 RepID=A0A420VCZ4_9BACI|nr:hypothetical protein Cdeb_01484 [Caldibacillus debilis GB1]
MPLAAANRCPKSTGRRYFFAARSGASSCGPILNGERGGAASRGPVHAPLPIGAGRRKNEDRPPAVSGAFRDQCRRDCGKAPVRAARTAAFRQSAPGRRTPILSPFSSSGAQAEAGRPRDRRIPLRVLPPACRGPARGRRDFRGERERTRDGQKASAGDGGPFCQTFGFRKGLGKPGRPAGNLPRLDRIRLQSLRRPGRSAGNLPPAMAPKNRGTTSAVFTGWEGPE